MVADAKVFAEHELDELGTGLPDAEASGGGVQSVAGGSVLDAIRHRRESIRREHFYDLKVPGYGGCLVLRCSPIKGAKLTQLRQRLEGSKDPERDFGLNADVLIDSCTEVLGRAHVDDDLETLDPTGETVRIDTRLAELFGVKTDRARDLVWTLFDAAPSPELACGVAVGEFAAWSQGAELDVEEDLLGES